MYIVNYTSGNWDDFHRGNLFVTEDKELAEAYADKANRLLEKIKEYYREIDAKLEDDEDPMRDIYIQQWAKYHTLAEVNAVAYEEIELR